MSAKSVTLTGNRTENVYVAMSAFVATNMSVLGGGGFAIVFGREIVVNKGSVTGNGVLKRLQSAKLFHTIVRGATGILFDTW